jgi:hypothetical protein
MRTVSGGLLSLGKRVDPVATDPVKRTGLADSHNRHSGTVAIKTSPQSHSRSFGLRRTPPQSPSCDNNQASSDGEGNLSAKCRHSVLSHYVRHFCLQGHLRQGWGVIRSEMRFIDRQSWIRVLGLGLASFLARIAACVERKRFIPEAALHWSHARLLAPDTIFRKAITWRSCSF